MASALLMAVLYLLHVHGWVGKPPSLVHQWHEFPAWRVYPLLALAALPFLAAHLLAESKPRLALVLLTVSLPVLQLAGNLVASNPYGFDDMVGAIQNRMNTSYYTDANRLIDARQSLGQILGEFPRLMPNFNMHAREKPPGPVLFYSILIRLLGRGRVVPLAAGWIIALVTGLSIPAIYALGRFLDFDFRAAFHAAAIFCMAPGVMFFFPQFDTWYPALVCTQALAWGLYLRTGRRRYLAALATLLWLATFWAYNTLVFGVFLTGIFILEARRSRAAFDRLGRAIYSILLFFLIAYGLLYLLTNFNPIATFQTALAEQKKADIHLQRPFPQTLPGDLAEFCVGIGWGAVLAAGLGAALRKPRGANNAHAAVWLSFVQLLVVAGSGLLRCETGRVWIFLMPLLAWPAGMEIAKWTPRWRAAFYAACWLAMSAVLANVKRF